MTRLRLVACGVLALAGCSSAEVCEGHITNIVFTQAGGKVLNLPDLCITNQQTNSFLIVVGQSQLRQLDLSVAGKSGFEQKEYSCDTPVGAGNFEAQVTVSAEPDSAYSTSLYEAGITSSGTGASCSLSVSSPFSTGHLVGTFKGHLRRELKVASTGAPQGEFLEVAFDFNTKTNPDYLNQ